MLGLLTPPIELAGEYARVLDPPSGGRPSDPFRSPASRLWLLDDSRQEITTFLLFNGDFTQVLFARGEIRQRHACSDSSF